MTIHQVKKDEKKRGRHFLGAVVLSALLSALLFFLMPSLKNAWQTICMVWGALFLGSYLLLLIIHKLLNPYRPRLLEAVKEENFDLVHKILDQGEEELNAYDHSGRTALCYLFEGRHQELVEKMMRHPAMDFSIELIQAIKTRNSPLLEFILANYHVDPFISIPDAQGKTPLIWACLEKEPNYITWFLRHRALNFVREFMQSIAVGVQALTKELYLLKKELVDAKDESGKTPLIYAAEYNNEEVLAWLLSKEDIFIEAKDESGLRALHYGALNGYLAIVSKLITHGATIDAIDHRSSTPLMLACRMGNKQVSNFLIKKGTNLDQQDDKGRTALHYATRQGLLFVINNLINHGALVDARDHDEITPLMIAQSYQQFDAMKLLIRSGAETSYLEDDEEEEDYDEDQ